MVSDIQNYIRTRCSMDSNDWFCIWNGSHPIYDAGVKFNRDGEITLMVSQ